MFSLKISILQLLSTLKFVDNTWTIDFYLIFQDIGKVALSYCEFNRK